MLRTRLHEHLCNVYAIYYGNRSVRVSARSLFLAMSKHLVSCLRSKHRDASHERSERFFFRAALEVLIRSLSPVQHPPYCLPGDAER